MLVAWPSLDGKCKQLLAFLDEHIDVKFSSQFDRFINYSRKHSICIISSQWDMEAILLFVCLHW